MAAAARPRLLVPGLVPRDPGRERHRVRRGSATAILLEPDDRLTIRDLDGGQRAELTVLGFGTDGFDVLDYWNQTYNRRVVENEIKKLDAAGKRELAKQLAEQADKDEAKEPAAKA